MNRTSLAQVEELALQLPETDQRTLAEHLLIRLRRGLAQTPRDLYGAWKDSFSNDVDLDSALKEIRSAWKSDGLE